MKLKWTVEFEVDDIWVADGFRLTDELAKKMIETELPHCYDGETAARVIKHPSEEEIFAAIAFGEKQ